MESHQTASTVFTNVAEQLELTTTTTTTSVYKHTSGIYDVSFIGAQAAGADVIPGPGRPNEIGSVIYDTLPAQAPGDLFIHSQNITWNQKSVLTSQTIVTDVTGPVPVHYDITSTSTCETTVSFQSEEIVSHPDNRLLEAYTPEFDFSSFDPCDNIQSTQEGIQFGDATELVIPDGYDLILEVVNQAEPPYLDESQEEQAQPLGYDFELSTTSEETQVDY